MKFDRSSVILGVIIGVSLFIQLLSLSTQYVGRYDYNYACSDGDTVDCGPSNYVITTAFGAVDIETGPLNAQEIKALHQFRIASLLLPLILEVAAVVTLIKHNRKK